MTFKDNLKDISRIKEIVQTLFRHDLGSFVLHLKLKDHLNLSDRLDKSKLEKDNHNPEKLRLVFEDLGGTFIKLGQLLSLRPDLIPKEYCNEFKKLQDQVKPFSSKEAREIIEKELKKPITEVFKSFSEKPIAAASIAQVYEAKLLDGKKVAVKVQRPGIKEKFKTDIDIMYYLAKLFERYQPQNIIHTTDIISEFENYTKCELDFLLESRNIEHFYENFKNDSNIIIPKVYRNFSTEKVVVMEFIDGKKISEAKKEIKNPKKIVQLAVSAVLKQIFIDGFFHADPHPGNIFIVDQHKIAFLDFGIIGRLDHDLKENVTALFISVIKGDIDSMAPELLELGFINQEVNMTILKQDLYYSLSKYYGVSLKKIDFGEVFNNLIDVAKKNNITLPTNFVLLSKSIITIEGFAADLDPDFDIVHAARPFIEKLKKEKTSPKRIIQNIKESTLKLKNFILALPDNTRQVVRKLSDADYRMKEIDTDLKTLTVEMNRSSNRISLGLLITGFIIAGASMIQLNQFKIWNIPLFSFIAFCTAGIFIVLLLKSILSEKKNF